MRHPTISLEFVANLIGGFACAAERVRNAATWEETQQHMIRGTYPYLRALQRVENGFSRGEIELELDASLPWPYEDGSPEQPKRSDLARVSPSGNWRARPESFGWILEWYGERIGYFNTMTGIHWHVSALAYGQVLPTKQNTT